MTFSVLGLTGSLYGLCAGLSVLCYLAAAIWLHRKTQFNADTVLTYGILGIPLGLVFARIVFSAANYTYFLQTLEQPAKMLYVWDGGLSMSGMLLGLVLAALLTAKLKRLIFSSFLDAMVLPLGVLLFGLRLAEGLTEGFGIGRSIQSGTLTQSLPFFFINETFGTLELHRIAVFRLEAVFALIILGLMFLLKLRKGRRPGDLSLLFFALYGAGQVLFESMRSDGHMVIIFIRVQQVLGLLAVLVALGVFCHRYGTRHGARDTVTAAWTMLPIMAVILWMMIFPINHVLDLSDHIWLGIGVLAAMGVYLGFFLRIRGANLRLILTWIAALLTVAACVMLEFSMDGSQTILRDYSLLGGFAALLFLYPLSLFLPLSRVEAKL